jgi:hypothetical protein
MLKPEQARAELEKVRSEHGEKRRLAALAKLPKHLAEIGRGTLGRDPRGRALEEWDEQNRAERTAGALLDELAAGDRLKVLEALFPRIGAHVGAAWDLTRRLPYDSDFERKAFRAPRDPALTRSARLQWFSSLLGELEGYEKDLAWLAAWAGYLSHGYSADTLGIVFAAAIDAGGKEGDTVFNILCDSARGSHPVGAMGRHVTRALLVAARPDGWEFVEKMLLAAQRQEGLRQTILETVDEAHPEAFRRMVRLILENDLARFSATVRALNVWFGFQWDSVSVRVVNRVLERVLRFLEGPDARAEALQDPDAETVYLALWAMAFEDAPAAVKPAAALLSDPDVERRFAAAHLLAQLQIPAARAKLLPALDDADLRVALCALEGCERDEDMDDAPGRARAGTALFEPLERLLERVPEKRTYLEPIIWPWHVFTADRQTIAASLVSHLGKRPATMLLRHLPSMESSTRRLMVEQLAGLKRWDAQTRDALFALVGDSSITVREAVLRALAKCEATDQEILGLEEHLSRKSGDLRRGVLTLLLKQSDAAALASADRLLKSPDALRRQAGLEILRQLAEAKRLPGECRARAEQYRADRARLTDEEQKQLDAILDADRAPATLDDALGLLDPGERTKPVPPKARKVTFMTPAALACLQSLDDLIHKNRQTKVVLKDDSGDGDETEPGESRQREELLGNLNWGFPYPVLAVPLEKDVARLPLRELWETWYAQRPRGLRDKDGMELLRAETWLRTDADDEKDWRRKQPAVRRALDLLSGGLKRKEYRYSGVLLQVLMWLGRLHPARGAADFLLDATETSFALVPAEEVARADDPEDWENVHWRQYNSPFTRWLGAARNHARIFPGAWTGAHHVRLWRLVRWMDERAPGVLRVLPELMDVWRAFEHGGATEADVLDQLLGPRYIPDYGSAFDDLHTLTAKVPPPEFRGERFARLFALVDRCRERILDVELERGDTPTAASAPARDLQSVWGTDILVRLLRAFGKSAFTRQAAYLVNYGKEHVLTHLVRVSYPREADTPEDFAAKVQAAGLTPQRLIELAFLAPQWVRHVEAALGWPSSAEGVWWFIAHTREQVGEDEEDEGRWKTLLAERTALTPEELAVGAVDVAWFHRAYAALGADRWQQLYDAAKYASTGQGHQRARVLADVLLGKAERGELIAGVRTKRLRDSVRNLGLLPLAGGKARAADLLERYQILQEYHRYARQLGSMSRDSALEAVGTGMANLARTAGYPDPLRFEWAMEAEAVADLAKGAATVRAKGVDVRLAIDSEGQPEVKAARQGQTLKTVPAEVKKDARVKELLARKTEIKRQASRMRLGLESAMCRGDVFTGEELRRLCAHPVLAPRLERLVLLGEGIAGYPVSAGRALRDHAGQEEPVKKDEALRLAHPLDLLQRRDWQDWQHDCFAAERVQPFKQVFRELYVMIAAEKKDGVLSRRYAGQQVNPRQAVALWTGRGWVAGEYEGVRRTFPEAGLTAEVVFRGGYFTPAEVEGATLEGVQFFRRGEAKPLKLTEVPPRTFSEVMRDLDLVVSVAHRGGVDPEASASTVEMRAALLKETCALLKLKNVKLKGSHALIDGHLGNYSVHLGSAVIHRQPGGHLCLVPVHAQHRGRLFLPFADDDPKTAEVVSKVILLARDEEIQDPGILDQLRAVPV